MRLLRSNILLFLVCCCYLCSCSSTYHTSKYKFEDGVYYTNILTKNRVYLTSINDDTTITYPASYIKDSLVIDKNRKTIYSTTLKKYKGDKYHHSFYKPSLDIDIQTVAFKYRPSESIVPNQLFTTYNGVLYLGYRADKYKLDYTRTPLNVYKRDVKHIVYSAGFFIGFGNSIIDEFVTNKNVNIEYSGVLLITGGTVMVGLKDISLGIGAGFDQLLDKNRKYWIYEKKGWIGLIVGISID